MSIEKPLELLSHSLFPLRERSSLTFQTKIQIDIPRLDEDSFHPLDRSSQQLEDL